MASTHNFTRLDEARQGVNPTVICKLASGWVFLGDSQFLRGYSILFADPEVESLGALEPGARATYLRDYALLGDAVQAVTGAKRINYSILGNVLPILHGHIFPRYDSEEAGLRSAAVWTYPDFEARGPRFDLARDAQLMAAICAKLRELGADVEQRAYPWQAQV
jgi:diadenosine tetraphosphate (Ap4A) HIT family hydrolase